MWFQSCVLAKFKIKINDTVYFCVVSELRTGMGRPDITKQVRAPKGSSGGDGAAGKEEQCVQVIRVEGLDSGTVVGIAFAAFLIGVMLTAALWFIHTHTGK